MLAFTIGLASRKKLHIHDPISNLRPHDQQAQEVYESCCLAIVFFEVLMIYSKGDVLKIWSDQLFQLLPAHLHVCNTNDLGAAELFQPP